MTTGDSGGLVEHRGAPQVDPIYERALDIVCKRLQWSRDNPSDYVKGWAREMAAFGRMHIPVADTDHLYQKFLAIRNAVRLAQQSGDNEGALQVIREIVGEG